MAGAQVSHRVFKVPNRAKQSSDAIVRRAALRAEIELVGEVQHLLERLKRVVVPSGELQDIAIMMECVHAQNDVLFTQKSEAERIIFGRTWIGISRARQIA